MLTPNEWNWGAAAAILAVDLGVAVAVLLWSRRVGWNMRHKLALGSGAALAYAWHAFIEKPAIGGSGVAVRIGNSIFALGAVVPLVFASRRTLAVTRKNAITNA
ncbi:MAG: hypothetical protein WA419_15775 [Silvibacterium sp.]